MKKHDIPFFVLFGFFKLLSDGCLFYAQGEVALSLSALLQMTAPYFVMLFSIFIFREKLTSWKLLTIVLAFTGCTMVTGVAMGNINMNVGGIISGILSGLFYGLFIIGGKISADKGYSPITTVFYFFTFAAVSAIVFTCFTSDLPRVLSMYTQPDTLAASLVLGIVLTLLPFYLINTGCTRIPASLASMIAVLELVVGTLVGWFVFDEVLAPVNIAGMAVVVLAIVISDRTVVDSMFQKLTGRKRD